MATLGRLLLIYGRTSHRSCIAGCQVRFLPSVFHGVASSQFSVTDDLHSRRACFHTSTSCSRYRGALSRRYSVSKPKNEGFFKKDTSKSASTPTQTEEFTGTIWQRYKQMYTKYWYVLIPVHCVTSAVWISGFYYAAMCGVDVMPLLETIGVPDYLLDPLKHSKAGHFASAFAMYKVASPARYLVTVAGTTVSIQHLRRWGYIKPVPSGEELKQMVTEKGTEMKTILKEKHQSMLKNHATRMEAIRTKRNSLAKSILGKKLNGARKPR